MASTTPARGYAPEPGSDGDGARAARVRRLVWLALACSGAACIPVGDPYPGDPADPAKCALPEAPVDGPPPCSGEPDSWCPTSTDGAPEPRFDHAMVWTGTEAIVWGGLTQWSLDPWTPEYFADGGGRHDPVADAWRPVSTEGAPIDGASQVAIWTGTEMIVWGGITLTDSGWIYHDTGARYDPAEDAWTPMSTMGAPAPRGYPVAFWTGEEVLVWGGVVTTTDEDNVYFADGGRYDPAMDRWRPVSSTGAPEAGHGRAAVWSGTELIVWGGQRCKRWGCLDGAVSYPTRGGRYDPLTDTWTPATDEGAPSGRGGAHVVWTGNEMIVWGGVFVSGTGVGEILRDGARYDPAGDRWIPMSCAGAPDIRGVVVWTGAQMIVWGPAYPSDGSSDGSIGGRYDPGADSWAPVLRTGAATRRVGAGAVWTGREMVVWGGKVPGVEYAPFATGARYTP